MSSSQDRVSKPQRRSARLASFNPVSRSSTMSNALGPMTVVRSIEGIKYDGIFPSVIRGEDILDQFFPENDAVRRVISTLENAAKPFLKQHEWQWVPINFEESSVLAWLLTARRVVNQALNDLGIPRFQRREIFTGGKTSLEDGSQPDGLLWSHKTLGVKPFLGKLREGDSVPYWGQVLVAIEHKKSYEQFGDAKDQICDRARRILSAQSNRYYCFGIILAKQWLSLLYFDRRGVIQTPQINYLENPTALIRLLVGFMTLSDEEFGLSSDYTREDDATVSMEFDGVNLGRMKIRNLEVLRPSSELVGRGTTLFRGEMDGKPLVVKETFPHRDRPHEGGILAKVHSHSGGQAVNVPKCIDFEEDRDALVNLEITRRAIEDGTWLPRVRRRIIFEEHLKDVRLGSTPECLLIAADGALSGILSCMQAGIVHCDISQGNMMLTQDEKRGILIDFDHAYDLNAEAGTTHRSGTPPFMSLRMLSKSSSINAHEDDVESVFWTVLWIAFTSNGPMPPPSPCPIAGWITVPMDDLADEKWTFISDLETDLNDMALFYASLKEVILKMKTILFDEEQATVEDTIEQLKRVIREARETLVDGGRIFEGYMWGDDGVVMKP